jgi:hypothetical protein
VDYCLHDSNLPTELLNIKDYFRLEKISYYLLLLIIVETVLGESYAKELRYIPLVVHTVGRRTSDIPEGLCDQLIDQHKTSRLVFQLDEATNAVKGVYLIT